MKKVVIIMAIVAMIMGLGIGSASAADNTSSSLTAGTFGINVGFQDSSLGGTGVIMISGKYLVLNDLAITAGVGLQASSGDLNADFFALSGGVRKYFRTNEFAPFVEGKFTYVSEDIDIIGVDRTTAEFSANFGAEYFLHKQFSIEGSVGLGFGTVNDKNSIGLYYFGTHRGAQRELLFQFVCPHSNPSFERGRKFSPGGRGG
jgi:hypothetical protein